MVRKLKILFAALAVSLAIGQAQTLPNPTPDPGGPPNVYYGANPSVANAPVLVFIHGLRGQAQNWWIGNDMYALAYLAGYRTAFININADGTPNDLSVTNNAKVLTGLLPGIAQRFGVQKFYVVAHSKGGIDLQAAILDPNIGKYVKAVFQISTPNNGTQLADWAYGAGSQIAIQLGLQSPGIYPLQTNTMAVFRSLADNVSNTAGIPYFTMAGSTASGSLLTQITGGILSVLAPNDFNDGLVPYASTKLPISYGTDLGLINAMHFETDTGSLALPRINAQIRNMEAAGPNFTRMDNGSGFGDRQNSLPWSMQWFKGKLYVGTGRAFLCMTAASSDAQQGTKFYKPTGQDYECAATPDDLPLQAEIWQYTPETNTWLRVYQSPNDVPIQFDEFGNPTKYTAHEFAYRGMVAYTEADGTEALYVGGVGAGSVFAYRPPYNQGTPYPAPRILRSTDGVNFAPIPQTPGTFLGDIGIAKPGQIIQVRGFRSFTAYKGKLFVTATDFLGTGSIIASADPKSGDNAWFAAAPPAEQLPTWNLKVFNGYLYAGTGSRTAGVNSNGYGVYKTDASGSPPYNFTPVVTDGAGMAQNARALYALAMEEFNGKLYVGTDRPTELIRISPDDTWELVVGTPRNTSTGLKLPISGMVTGFGNYTNGHFWHMTTESAKQRLLLGTWDWSIYLNGLPAMAQFFGTKYGFDLYSTKDGVNWDIESTNGFGDKFNYGVRRMVDTPQGLYLGAANPFYGLQIWKSNAAPLPSATTFGAPTQLKNSTSAVTTNVANLSWKGVTGAMRYDVFRVDPTTPDKLLTNDMPLKIPGFTVPVTVGMIRNGFLDSYCLANPDDDSCNLVDTIKNNRPVPGPAHAIGSTSGTTFTDNPPSGGQSIYFVRAEDWRGNLSNPSNVAGGPLVP